MKKSSLLSRSMWLFGLTLAVLAGCGGKSSGRSGAGSASAAFDFRVYDLNGTEPVFCADVGATDIVTTLVNAVTNETFSDTFPCNDVDWAFVTNPVPVGDYTMTYELHTDTTIAGNTLLDMQTFPAAVSDVYHLAPGTSTLDGVDFMVNAFDAAWSVTRGGLPATCRQVGGSFVRLDVMYPGATQPTPYTFDCGDYVGLTMGIPISDSELSYPVTWQMVLLDANLYPLASTQPVPYTVYYDENAVLPPVTFSL